MSTLALIAARGGSKRVPGKNIRLLGGKPLIAYTIEAAKSAAAIDRVLVSTDNEKIASIARQLGAEVPFLRPPELSTDQSTEYEFHRHALEWLRENENYEPDLIVNLYPTTPFRKSQSIEAAVQLMRQHPAAECLRSVTKCSEHPWKMWVVKDKYLEPLVPHSDPSVHTLSYHLLPPTHIQNASIYITRPTTLNKYQSTLGHKVLAFEMDANESIDINSEIDFAVAEQMLNEGKL